MSGIDWLSGVRSRRGEKDLRSVLSNLGRGRIYDKGRSLFTATKKEGKGRKGTEEEENGKSMLLVEEEEEEEE
jgi:hypothetical protein